MMNGAGSTATCHNPACSSPMETSTRSGRPRKYCSDTCRRAYYRAGAARRTSPDAERHDQYVQQILDELGQRVDRLRDLAHADRTGLSGADSLRSQTLALLKGSAEISKDIQDLDAAIAQQARDRGIKVVDIAKARNISADKVSRDWPADSIDRRMNQRQQRRTSSTLHGSADAHDLAHEALYLPGRYLPGEELEPGLSGHGHDLTEGPPPPSSGQGTSCSVRACGTRRHLTSGTHAPGAGRTLIPLRSNSAAVTPSPGTSSPANDPSYTAPRPHDGLRGISRASVQPACRAAARARRAPSTNSAVTSRPVSSTTRAVPSSTSCPSPPTSSAGRRGVARPPATSGQKDTTSRPATASSISDDAL